MGCGASASDSSQGVGGNTGEPPVFSPGKVTDVYQLDPSLISTSGSHTSVSAARKRNQTGDSSQQYAIRTRVKNFGAKSDADCRLAAMHREIRIMQSMSHPNILKLFEVYADHRNIYLVTELCAGGELFDRIIDSGGFSESQSGHVMVQLFHAVNYLHTEKSITHRDLKPENFLLLNRDAIDARDNHLKLIDFGISCPFVAGQKLRTKVGAPTYIAPEVLAGSYDERCDLWSCGVNMFIMLCGYPPFDGDCNGEIVEKVKEGKIHFAPQDWLNVSEDAKDLIRQLLVKDPSCRISAKDAIEHNWISKSAKEHRQPLSDTTIGLLRSTKNKSTLAKLALQMMASFSSSAQIAELQTTFKDIDKNGDGTITIAELKEGLTRAGVPRAEMQPIFAAMDADGSGKIEYEEFLASTIEKGVKLKVGLLWDTFKEFDKNGDGQMSKSELRQVAEDLSKDGKWDAKAIEGLVKESDDDGDGQISFEEFKAALLP